MRNRREMLRLIGQALGVQHRVSGRVAVDDKPDVLWDRPDLERLYARLEDEYELKERGQTLQRKLERHRRDRPGADRNHRRRPLLLHGSWRSSCSLSRKSAFPCSKSCSCAGR